jgi:hypothetical protein
MVRDNPETFIDLDGHDLGGGTGESIQESSSGSDSPVGGLTAPSSGEAKSKQGSTDPSTDKKSDDKDDKKGGGPGKGGKPGKGERKKTSKPDGTPNPGKHARPISGKPGRYEVKDPHTGKWIEKPPGWSPTSNMTDFEVQQNQNAARYMQNFWTAVVAGDVMLGAAAGGAAAGGLTAGAGSSAGIDFGSLAAAAVQ